MYISICPFQGVSKSCVRKWPTETTSFPPKKGYSGNKDYFSFSHSLSTCRKCSLWWRNIADLLLYFPGSLEPLSHVALKVLAHCFCGTARAEAHGAGRDSSVRELPTAPTFLHCHIPQHSSEGPLSHQHSKGKHSCVQASSCCALLCLSRIMHVYRLTQKSVEEST